MRELVKYDLKLDKILEYFHSNLGTLNLLCKEVLKQTPFDEGEFYTLMPKGLIQRQLYDFRGGCVKSHGIQEGVCDFIIEKQKTNSSLVCIFDDFNEDYSPDFDEGDSLFSKVAIHFDQKEIYLVPLKIQVYQKVLQKCFQMTDCIWHSLMVMSDIPFTKSEGKGNSISREQLEEVAKTAKLVVLRAYDQEGYVFWERGERINKV